MSHRPVKPALPFFVCGRSRGARGFAGGNVSCIFGFYVELGDGTQWEVERLGTFPVVMFKEERAKVILQLGETQRQ